MCQVALSMHNNNNKWKKNMEIECWILSCHVHKHQVSPLSLRHIPRDGTYRRKLKQGCWKR